MRRNRVNSKFASIAVIFIMAFGFSTTMTPSIQKKIDKELASNWPEKTIVLDPISLPDSVSAQAREIGIMKVYDLVDAQGKMGYMVYFQVPSKFDYFDLAIFYDTTIHIKSMRMLAYREDHGGEVGSKRWLKQFIGLSSDDPISLNDDIQGISGATISCESATKGAKEVTEFLYQLELK